MLDLPRAQVFHEDLHPDLHRGPEHPVYLRSQDNELADVNGVEEGHVVDRRCHHRPARVPNRGERTSEIHQRHHFAAKQRPQRIGIIRQREFRHLRNRVPNGAALQFFRHIFFECTRASYHGGMSARANALRALLEQDPKNSFARYGLALDHANNGDLEAAVTEFKTVIANDANYCAAYFHGGQTLEKLGKLADAAELYKAGIEATKRTGDAHTRSELEGALSMIA